MSKVEMNEAEKLRLLEERIRAPSIWGKVPCGIRFEDLQDKRYEEAVKMVKKHYLPEEIAFKSVKFTEDQEAVDEMIHQVRIWMKDKMSIAAVKEGINKLVGVLIMRIQEKHAFSRTFSNVKLHYNEKYVKILDFYKEIEKPINLFSELGVKRYLKIYLLAFKTRYRHRGLGKEMIKAAMKLAAAATVPAISSIFTTGRSQQTAAELGFRKFNEIYYVRYLKDEEIVFWDTGVGNYGAALMAYRIPEVDEPEEDLTKVVSSRFTFQLKGDIEIDEIKSEEDKEDSIEQEQNVQEAKEDDNQAPTEGSEGATERHDAN